MYRDDQRLVLSPTDLIGYLTCAHYTTLSLAHLDDAGRPRRASDSEPDDGETDLDVVTRRGLEHEAAYLASLHHDGLDVVEIHAGTGPDAMRVAENDTRVAMNAGMDVVFQGAFYDEHDADATWRGHADFLRRVDGEAGHHYEAEDTKLARHVKPSAVIQLCSYSEQLERIQGVEPEQVHVVLGGQERVSLTTREFAAYYRHAKARYLEALEAGHGTTYPLPVEHCSICRYSAECTERREVDDHLSLVANLTRDQVRNLGTAGVTTVEGLAVTADSLRVRGIGDPTLERLRRQARLQVAARTAPDEPPPYEVLAPGGQDHGLEALAIPDEGDLFFDIEGDPFIRDAGLEYLLGVGWYEHGEFRFRDFWAHSPAEEKESFEAFVDFVVERRGRFPDMHVYHYAPYEPTALGKLMGRHATREDEVDDLFRGRVLVDLYRVVRQSVAVGSPSYSIKKLEPLYMARREEAITDAGSSIVEYERWLQTGDEQILDDLRDYNRADCESTALLRDWLEARRDEFAARGTALERPSPPSVTASGAEAEDVDGESALVVERLLGGMDARPEASDREEYARWLLAHLVDWHRREDKPEWWQFFRRVLEFDDDDLIDDTESIGGLTYVGPVGTVKRSTIHRYSFDPDQEHKFGVGSEPVDPAVQRSKLTTGAKGPRRGRSSGSICRWERSTSSAVMHRPRRTPHADSRGTDQQRRDAALRSHDSRPRSACVASGRSRPAGPSRISCSVARRGSQALRQASRSSTPTTTRSTPRRDSRWGSTGVVCRSRVRPARGRRTPRRG